MSSLALDYRYQPRDPARRLQGIVLVVALHAFLGYALVSGMARKGLNFIKKPLEAVVIQEVIIPPPPPPPPKEIQPRDLTVPRDNAPPPQIQQEVQPPPVVKAVELPLRDPTQPISANTVVIAAPSPVDNTKAIAASMESEYAAKLRAMLNSTKRYPTGRAASQQRPQGKVKVWFTLNRAGTLLDAGILESSNSNLLDDAAIATVRRGVYPAFPHETWVGQEQHKFSAEIEFTPPSS